MSHPHSYSDDDIDVVWRVMAARRDVRQFTQEPLPFGMVERLVAAAHMAPSVGFMQPWRFLRVTRHELRQEIYKLVEAERHETARHLPTRNQEFLKLKVEGILECQELLAAALMPDREAHVIGRRTMPDMDLASVGCAIQNMWLAARAEGVGLGWVSFFEPQALAQLLRLPEGARPVALLCLGRVPAFSARPQFEQLGWGERLDISQVLFDNEWPQGMQGTPAAY